MKNKKHSGKIISTQNVENTDSFANAPLDASDNDCIGASIIEGLHVKSMHQINHSDSAAKLKMNDSDAEDEGLSCAEIEQIKIEDSPSQYEKSYTEEPKEMINSSQEMKEIIE